jgi:arylsulfatase A-like enzyme
MSRYQPTMLLLACWIVAALLPHDWLRADQSPRRPNILLIVADDLGWNDVGYHNPHLRTPRLDLLARSGVQLDCHYIQPQGTPTRVALMTGRYPSRFGRHCCAASNEQAYPIGTLTMASRLKSL